MEDLGMDSLVPVSISLIEGQSNSMNVRREVP